MEVRIGICWLILLTATCSTTSYKNEWSISLSQDQERFVLDNTFSLDSIFPFDVKVFLTNCYGREEVAPNSLNKIMNFDHDQVLIEDKDGNLRTFSTMLFCPKEIKSMSDDDCLSVDPEIVKIGPKNSSSLSIPIYYISDIMTTCSSNRIRLHYYSASSRKIELTSNWIVIAKHNED